MQRKTLVWMTNDPVAADKLCAADVAFDIALAKAQGLKLADKIVAIRDAKAARQAAYDAVSEEA